MTCPFTFNGEQCTLTDPKHADLHYVRPGIRFTDKDSDQNQTKAAA